MSQPPEVPPHKRFSWPWLVWSLYVVLWTTGLVIPLPGDTFLEDHYIDLNRKFIFAKTLHVLAYAGMTILTGWLLVAPRFRWALMFFLMFHGTTTEMIQKFLSYRSGVLMDVMFDNCGVVLGVLASWRYWIAPLPGKLEKITESVPCDVEIPNA